MNNLWGHSRSTQLLLLHHSAAWLYLHCCKSDQAMEITRFWGRTPNPLNWLTKNLVWVITLAMTLCILKFKMTIPLGALVSVNYHSYFISNFPFFYFTFCDPKFCLCPETKPQNRILHDLLHMMSVPVNCIPRRIKMQKVYNFPVICPKLFGQF